MSLGMLKLFRGIFVIFAVTLIVGCDYANIYKSNNKVMEKEKLIEEKKIVKSKSPIKKTKVTEKKIINKTKVPLKQIDIVEIQEIKKIKVKKIKDIKKQTLKKEKKKTKATSKDTVRKSTSLKKPNLDEFAFDLIKMGKLDDNTLLIVGGIQGDEPGGFMAASLMTTHYKIKKGSVWIVPNLNFYSIIKRSRGPYGDMNRKFANLPKSDPEYKIIQRIKKYITDPNVKLILNLHDGSGFYRPMYIDRRHQPLKWGQASVIDQEILPGVKNYADTYTISEKVVNHINKHLLKEEDMYRTKNTHTRFKSTFEEKDMAKTLTFYAVSHGKAAFGHETSKSLTVPQRVYYKLLALEKYMDIMGIEYERKFSLTIPGIKKVLDDDISIKFKDTDITMPLKDIRNIQKYFPIKKDGVVRYLPSNPLIKIIKQNNIYIIYYGNRRLTKLEADYSEHLNFDTVVTFKVDGKTVKAKLGDTINVKNYFTVVDERKFRVNVIGYKHKSGNETNHKIYKKAFIKRFSIAKDGNMYRVEFYKGRKFAGMVLVNYTK